jgi:glyoxylase I family protein
MRVNGFHHAAIEARDIEKVAAFFRDVLGLPEVVRHHRPDGTLRSIWLAAHTDAQPGGPFIAVEATAHGVHAGAGWFMVALAISAAERPARARGDHRERDAVDDLRPRPRGEPGRPLALPERPLGSLNFRRR